MLTFPGDRGSGRGQGPGRGGYSARGGNSGRGGIVQTPNPARQFERDDGEVEAPDSAHLAVQTRKSTAE